MAGKKASLNEASKLDSGDGEDSRQRSKIGFPYTPLDDAVTMAQAIHAHVGMNECDDDLAGGIMQLDILGSAESFTITATRLPGASFQSDQALRR
jgi:hypothetical protein